MRFDPHQDAYRELGVPHSASAEMIRRAYRNLARRFHPDRAPEGKRAEYEERMKRINTAYDILSNPEKRALYDRVRNGCSASAPQVRPQIRHTASPTGNPTPQSAPSSARDPYPRMRAGYQRRLYRFQFHSRQFPRWAQLLTGLFAGLGIIIGFLLGLPFGIIGCIPGALVGMMGGILIGIGAVYLLTFALPIVLLGWLGSILLGETGLFGGIAIGAAIGILGIWYLIRRTRHP